MVLGQDPRSVLGLFRSAGRRRPNGVRRAFRGAAGGAMKALVFGLGSIGARHVRDLKALRPDCLVVGADPRLAGPLQSAISYGYHDNLPVTYLYEDWRKALTRHQ